MGLEAQNLQKTSEPKLKKNGNGLFVINKIIGNI